MPYHNSPDNDYDLDGRPFKEHEKKGGKEYELPRHDKESCREIKRRIQEGSYKDIEEVRDHLEFLEDLIEKVKNIILAEESEGIVNLSLKRDFSNIKDIFNELSKVLNGLEGF